jgi:hypothetical protein
MTGSASLSESGTCERLQAARRWLNIRPTDWITVGERARRMDEVIKEVCATNVNWDEMGIEQHESDALRALLT